MYTFFSTVSPYNRGCMFFLSAFLIEEDTELQRTAAISDHLIKTLTGFLVKNDLDDSSYALMREVSTLKYKGGEGGNVKCSSRPRNVMVNWLTDYQYHPGHTRKMTPLPSPLLVSDLSPFDCIYLNTEEQLFLCYCHFQISLSPRALWGFCMCLT